jgi:3-oxoacyl-[acyl-carrier-protein] synthase III
MRYDVGIYVAGAAASLPSALAVDEAVANGLCDRRAALRTGIRAVCVGEKAGPEYAAEAARAAVRGTGIYPGEIGLVLHSSTYHQGHDLWASASFVQQESIGGSACAIDIRQLSNGGMAALQLASAYLAATGETAALLTAGDRFCKPGFDRWNTDPGTMCADGGSALLLTKRSGYAALRSMVIVSDPSMEGLARGADAFSASPLTTRVPISISPEINRSRLTGSPSTSQVLARLREGQQRAFDQALKDADISKDDVSWFVVPHLGRPKMELQMFEPLGIPVHKTTWEWGSGVGHLGAGDQFAGLAYLRETGLLASGSFCVLLGVGAGFAWSAAVLEIV